MTNLLKNQLMSLKILELESSKCQEPNILSTSIAELLNSSVAEGWGQGPYIKSW